MLKLFPNPILFSWYKVNKITSIIEASIINYYDAVIRDHFFPSGVQTFFIRTHFLLWLAFAFVFELGSRLY